MLSTVASLSIILNFFLRAVSRIDVRVYRVQSCCTELFHVFLLDYFDGSIAHRTGRLARTIVQGKSSLRVTGQEHWKQQPGTCGECVCGYQPVMTIIARYQERKSILCRGW